MIKFDIELVDLNFFENRVLLILKCSAHYLGLPLIDSLAYDMLWLANFKEVITILSPKKHSPLSVLFSVCLSISNGLNMEEFDKCSICISFVGYFASFLGEYYALSYYLHSYSRFMLGYGCLMCFAGF